MIDRVQQRFFSESKRSKKEILIDNIIQLRPEFTIVQLSRLDLPTLNIIHDDVSNLKELRILKPQLSRRDQYIRDILRFAPGVDSKQLSDNVSTGNLKFLSMGF